MMQETKPFKIDIVGMDVTGEPLSEGKRRLIHNADVVIGGRNHLSSVSFFQGRTVCLSGDLSSLITDIEHYRKENMRIVVLASGDPLMFGIGNTLINHFGIAAVVIHPGISAVQAALSRLGLKPQDTVVLSRHGTHDDDLRRLIHYRTGVILTSHGQSPGEVIREMVETIPQAGKWQGYVCQCLGMPEETIASGMLQQICAADAFLTPNLLVVENPHPVIPLLASSDFGRPDDAYVHEGGLITHPEVRAVTFSKLRPGHGEILWDVGAGSGAVGIEAAHMNPYLTVYAIEKNEKRCGHIRANMQRHNVNNLSVVRGEALAVCPSLPNPDRVFIGGGGEQLADLLELCYERLSENGVMVINTVTVEAFETVRHFLKRIRKASDVIALQISRQQELAKYHVFKPDNPITIFDIRK
ncbi:MAG: precorrin-6y C5,15-methyltransferase (decarboxylating) subunit CbiE [Thermodesulfobacteriota bacterium]|nr:precorrin-6y C5,15-methyltransferase (decarboxylating) subunit CbiE [Thermodesulfobacteriota bacterium]